MSEVQTTNDKKTNQQPLPAKPQQTIKVRDLSQPVAVKILRFATPKDLPGSDVAMSIKSGGPTNQNRYEITWHPSARHHHIVFYSPDPKNRPREAVIHESQVSSWEPVE